MASRDITSEHCHSDIESRSRLFQHLPPDAISRIFADAIPRHVRTHSILTNQFDSAEYLFMLRTGSARHFVVTQDGQKLLLVWLVPGDIFGASALLDRPSTYLVSTEMVKDGSVTVWNRATIRKFVVLYPQLFANALAITSDYLVWYVSSHSALVSRNARQRVARVISSLASGMGRKCSDGVELHLTNEELANSANVTPFTVSRLLSRWQRQGALVKGRGKLVVRDPGFLVV
jgi:CRP/FNR family transcriptional regulator, nitrogen oxide reductase regulator